jgi:hypothetical protein
MKLFIATIAFATLTAGIASGANARPHHQRHCKTSWVHHHKVQRCW